jgi:hypothetical protein
MVSTLLKDLHMHNISVILQVFWLPLETVRPVKKVNTTCTRRLTTTAVAVCKSVHKDTELKMTIALQDT